MNEGILGIDVSKKDLSIALLLNTSYKKCKIANTREGFISLSKWLQAQGISKVKACMEATGSYGEKLAEYLSIKFILLILFVLKPLLKVN